jgi:hypothetical protein
VHYSRVIARSFLRSLPVGKVPKSYLSSLLAFNSVSRLDWEDRPHSQYSVVSCLVGDFDELVSALLSLEKLLLDAHKRQA